VLLDKLLQTNNIQAPQKNRSEAMDKNEALMDLGDLEISLHCHLDRATEQVDKQRTQNRLDAVKFAIDTLKRIEVEAIKDKIISADEIYIHSQNHWDKKYLLAIAQTIYNYLLGGSK
jgi:hypothetical protein